MVTDDNFIVYCNIPTDGKKQQFPQKWGSNNQMFLFFIYLTLNPFLLANNNWCE